MSGDSAYGAATVREHISVCTTGTETQMTTWHHSYTSMRLKYTDFTPVRRVQRGSENHGFPVSAMARWHSVELIIAVTTSRMLQSSICRYFVYSRGRKSAFCTL